MINCSQAAQESAQLKREIQELERRSAIDNHQATAISELTMLSQQISDVEPDVQPDGVHTAMEEEQERVVEAMEEEQEPVVEAVEEEEVREARVVPANVRVRTRKQSERIVKLKLAKNWGGEGSSAEKPLHL